VYVHAATRDNTRNSYQSAVRHFEVEWVAFCRQRQTVARYLADHAESLSINTLRQRLAALAAGYHPGFPDPPRLLLCVKYFAGIQALHPAQENAPNRCKWSN
jgi:hypothetical protein